MTIPFAFAVAALVTGRVGEGWLLETRRATLVAWGFLTVGIILGAWWSYEVLGWGGYWAWDPVENASFIPWLTATAYLHSVVVQERRGMLRVWNLSLIIATFCLTILGTFLTRSGVINSVHAFSESDIGAWLLAFLGLAAVTGIGLIAWRGDRLRTPGRIDSPVSREGAFLANNLLFAGFAFVVLLGTVFPLLVEALRDEKLSVGEPYFDRMTVPTRPGAAVPDGGRPGPAVAGGVGRGAAPPPRRAGLGGSADHGRLRRPRRPGRGPARGLRARRLRRGRHRPPVRPRSRRPPPGSPGARPGGGRCAGRWPATAACTAGSSSTSAWWCIAVALAASMGYTTKREFRLAEGERVSLQATTSPISASPGTGPARRRPSRPGSGSSGAGRTSASTPRPCRSSPRPGRARPSGRRRSAPACCATCT